MMRRYEIDIIIDIIRSPWGVKKYVFVMSGMEVGMVC